VIPRLDLGAQLVPELPPTATYWMPSEDEIADGAIGHFRGVWPLHDVRPEDAAAVVANEQAAVRALDAHATDAREFDRLARALEARPPGNDEVAGDRVDLGGLEVGVAGLSYALAAIGCVPAASCRGHLGDDAWSYHPIVFAAVDRPHAEWLLPRVRRARCGFGIGAGRENLLAIRASSILETMALAASVLREAAIIPPPPRAAPE
jgi:hypothetical protein